MDVSERNARIWRRDIEGKNGTFYRYTTSVSSKNQDGSYSNAYMDIKFSKKSGAPEKIENGAKCDFNGFMTVESYKDKEGKEHNRPVIMVMECAFENDPEDMGDSFSQAEDEIPF